MPPRTPRFVAIDNRPSDFRCVADQRVLHRLAFVAQWTQEPSPAGQFRDQVLLVRFEISGHGAQDGAQCAHLERPVLGGFMQR